MIFRRRPDLKKKEADKHPHLYPPNPSFTYFSSWRSAFFGKWVSWEKAWHLRMQGLTEMCHYPNSKIILLLDMIRMSARIVGHICGLMLRDTRAAYIQHGECPTLFWLSGQLLFCLLFCPILGDQLHSGKQRCWITSLAQRVFPWLSPPPPE